MAAFRALSPFIAEVGRTAIPVDTVGIHVPARVHKLIPNATSNRMSSAERATQSSVVTPGRVQQQAKVLSPHHMLVRIQYQSGALVRQQERGSPYSWCVEEYDPAKAEGGGKSPGDLG